MRTHHSIIAGLMLAGALALTGCSKDPVTKDLELYAAVVKHVVNPAELDPLEQKLQTARTPDDQVALMNAYAEVVERQVSVLQSYQPKTPEVAKLSDDLHAGMSQMAQTAREFQSVASLLKQAQASQSQPDAVRAMGRVTILMEKMDEGKRKAMTAASALDALAASKGVKRPK
ncbi:MAG: hypothetical protein Q4G70_02525 [Pseudomonadota bacterium]|nr:hypothetical protein [Pseudomonadota bacterium]